jgi:1,4-dihydroxy-2-naphthoyl-CoA hydrolase
MTTELVRSLNDFARNKHPGLVGVEIETCEPDLVTGRMVVGQEVVAGNNMVWAPVIITLADWLCAAGMSPNLPKGAGFTTIELKSNFLGTAAVGETVTGRATPVHKGKTTHVWDAVIRNETKDKTIALFRCTQMILHPRTQ